MDNSPQEHALVLYKTQPAKVVKTGAKIEIVLPTGRHIRVRAKDITLLHPGPVKSLSELNAEPTTDVESVWALLAGTTLSLAELSDWLYDDFSPATAWQAWQYVTDGLYFSGSPAQITAHTEAHVTVEKTARAAKAAEKSAWQAFLARVQRRQLEAGDTDYLKDAEALALGNAATSRVLRTLKRPETPESAHKLLLDLHVWTPKINPYPARFGLPTTPPTAPIPDLPDEHRRDLTTLAAFAIDDANSNDPDDAISWDGERLWVHIADAAALISEDSAADLTARARGANLYLPDGTVPMLPPAATEKLALGLSEVSPALSFALTIAADGTPTCTEIVPTWVRVTRMSYTEADTQLNTPALAPLWRIAQNAQRRRVANNAIELDLPEVKVRVSDDGTIRITPLPPLKSRTVVREAMLLCGEALASFAIENDFPLPFSVQPPPDFSEDFPPGLAGMFARRKKMRPGAVTRAPEPHAGLGLPHYTQATSPLRRYGDLVAHQQIRRFLRGDTPFSVDDLLTKLAAARDVSGDVRRVERLSNQHWTLVYFLQNPDWQGDGVVVEKQGNRHTIIIPELDYEFRKHLRSDVPLNATVSVQVVDVDLPQLQAFFTVSLP